MIPYTPGTTVPIACPECNMPLDATTLTDHALCCVAAQTLRTTRHSTVLHVLRRCISNAGVNNHAEISLTEHHFPRRPGFNNNINLRADIVTYSAGAATRAIDVVVMNPSTAPPSQPLPPGATARVAEDLKLHKYNAQLVFPQRAMVPFAMETYGAWGQHARSFFRDLASHVAEPGTKAYMAWVFRWSKAISCALVKGNANLLGVMYHKLALVNPTAQLLPAHHHLLANPAAADALVDAAPADPT
jgi:hypothetical protein